MRIHNITFDAADPAALAAFWSSVLDRPVADGASADFAQIAKAGDVPGMLFIRVPEGKTAKNRVHLDLAVDDLDAERSRLEALGAVFVHERQEYGVHWCTLRDPEGNELCIAVEG